MNRQTAIIITIIVAVLTLCPSVLCCIMGVGTLAGYGSYDLGTQMGDTPQWVGIPFVCLGLLVWVVPLALWFFLVRRKQNEQPE